MAGATDMMIAGVEVADSIFEDTLVTDVIVVVKGLDSEGNVVGPRSAFSPSLSIFEVVGILGILASLYQQDAEDRFLVPADDDYEE